MIISQSNGHEIKFIRNGKHYDLVTDVSFWKLPKSIEKFYEDLSQKYMILKHVDVRNAERLYQDADNIVYRLLRC